MNFIFENGEPREAQRGDTPTHVLVPLAQVVRDVDGGDWSEVRVGGEVVYRGHDDEAKDYALELLGAEMVWDEPVSGERVSQPVAIVRGLAAARHAVEPCAHCGGDPLTSPPCVGTDPLSDLNLVPDHDPDSDPEHAWSIITDLRAPGSPDGGMSDDANYEISDFLRERYPNVMFDPEFSGFYAYAATKHEIEEVAVGIRAAVMERRGVTA